MKTASSDEDLAFKQPLFRMQIGFGFAAGSFTPGWCLWHLLLCFFSPSLHTGKIRSHPDVTSNAAQETKGCSGVHQEGEEVISDHGCLRLGMPAWPHGITQRMDGWSAGELSNTSSCAHLEIQIGGIPTCTPISKWKLRIFKINK